MKKILTVAALCTLFAGCASSPQEKAVNKMLEMQRDKTELVNKGIVAGFGVGESASEQMAYDEADLNARTDAARMLESKVEALFRNYEEEVGGELTEHQESIRKNVVSSLQNGVTVVKMDMETTENGRFKIYAVAAMDPEVVKKVLEAELQARNANVERMKAMSGYKKLDEEAKALDEYKAKQVQQSGAAAKAE